MSKVHPILVHLKNLISLDLFITRNSDKMNARNGFKKHLSSMLRVDREFRGKFVDLLLKYEDGDILELTESLVANLKKSEISNVMDIQRVLIDLLSDRKMIIFIRVMKMTERTISWSRRFRNIAFSDDTGIDLFRISNTAWRLPQFRVFDFLNNEERAVLEQLSMTEIDFISDLTSLGFNVFSTISRLSKEEISFLLSIRIRHRNLMIKFGFNRTCSIAGYEKGTRTELLKTDGELDWSERSSLGNLLDDQGAILRDFSIKENMDVVLKNIGRCREEELITLSHLRNNEIRNFSESETKILEKITLRVLQMASTLTRSELDEILLLPKGMFSKMLSADFRELVRDFPEGNPPIKLGGIQDSGLRSLNHDQRHFLVRIHKLPPRAVGILFDLQLDRIKMIMTSGVGSNRREEYLIRTLKNLSPQNRHDITSMTDEEWRFFHGTAPIDLNAPEIEVLRAMNLLNEKQLDFVKRMSRTGLGILATNSGLGPKTINSIMQLKNEDEKIFLLNLDLGTRFLIGNGTRKYDMTSEGEQLLKEMIKLNEKEKWWMGQTKFTEVLGCLNGRKVKVFGDLFEKIESDKHPVFDVWNGEELSEMDTKLLANVIIAQRPKSIEFLPVLDFLDSIFFMELLKLSVEASCDEALRLNIIQEIRKRDFKVRDLVNVYDHSKSQHVQLLRWIFINSLEPENEILFHFTRITLFDYLQGRNRLTFEQIFHPTPAEVIPSLHKQFVIEEYHLAKAFLSNFTDSTRLFDILNPVDCSILLDSVVTKATVGIPPDLVPLLQKLSKEKVIEFFATDWGREFLHSSLSHGRINLLRFLRQRLTDVEMKGMIRKDNYSIVKGFLKDVRSAKHGQHLAIILHTLREMDPDIPVNCYTEQSVKLISSVQVMAPPARTVSVIRSLMIDPIELENLDPRVRFILLNPATDGCQDSLIPCLDSRDIREIPSGGEDIFNKGRLTGPEKILALIAGEHDEIPASDASFFYTIAEIAVQITRRFAQVPRGSIIGFLASVGLVDLNVGGNLIFLEAKYFVNIVTDYRATARILKDLREHSLRTEREDHSLYRSMFSHNETSQAGEIDLDADDEILQRFASRVIDRFEPDYDWIGLSLPRWIVRKSDWYVRSIPSALPRSGSVPCTSKTERLPVKLVFDRRAVVREPYYKNETLLASPHLLREYKDYYSVCGPSAKELEIVTVFQHASPHFQLFCNSFPGDLHWNISTNRYRLPGDVNDSCHNMVLYKKKISSRSKRMLYVNQDHFDWESSESPSVDLIFHGNEINFIDFGSEMTINHFMLKGDLATCKIHKKGLNFFYTDKNELLCDLDITQDNVAVIHRNFEDSESISSVIGNGSRNKITITHASFVDGGGGNDEIIALHSTIVRAHFGDLIIGNATVVLPDGIDQIHSITIEPTTFIFWYKTSARIEVDRNCQLMLSNGYYVLPIDEYNGGHRIRRIGLRKTLEVHLKYDEQLNELRDMRNANFELIKYSYSPNQIFMITEMDHNVFVTDRDDQHYYWEALPNTTNLYIFTQLNSTATISQANGIMDLASLQINMEDINLLRTNVGLLMSYKSLRIISLFNYNEVRMTFDRKKYYRLWYNDLERDYCSHPLKMSGTVSIDYLELIYQYNCLDVKSDKLHLVHSNESLILVWNSGTLYLENYYLFVHMEWDLSVRLDSYIMEPAEFRRRANNPSSIKYYEVDERGLEIYHNQPDNKYDIGLINLGGWSLKKCNMTISDDDLSIALGVNSSVTVKHWLTHPSSRELVFYFRHELFLNFACLVSYCSPHDVLHEFENIKSQGRRSKRETNNFGFFFVVFQNWLDRKYPLPVQHCHAPEEIFADAHTLTETFKSALHETAEEFNIPVDGFDFFEVYTNVSKLMRAEKYSLILNDFHKIAETVGLDGDILLDRFFENIRESC